MSDSIDCEASVSSVYVYGDRLGLEERSRESPSIRRVQRFRPGDNRVFSRLGDDLGEGAGGAAQEKRGSKKRGPETPEREERTRGKSEWDDGHNQKEVREEQGKAYLGSAVGVIVGGVAVYACVSVCVGVCTGVN